MSMNAANNAWFVVYAESKPSQRLLRGQKNIAAKPFLIYSETYD